jgi:hypothetical protein
LRVGFVLVCAGAVALVAACGETRRPVGEECLRNEDCLSSVCSAGACVPAPPFVTGAGNPPPDEEPRIPNDGGSGAAIDAPADVRNEAS